MEQQGSERRRFKRLVFDGEARIRKGQRSWNCALVDISLKGALAQKPDDLALQVEDRVTFEVILGEGALVISMEASAAHVGDDLCGFRFEQVDIASFAHLRRLIELNLGDPDLLQRELSALIDSNTRR